MARRPANQLSPLGLALEELIASSEYKTHVNFREALGLGKSTLSQAMNGVRPPKARELRRWLAHFPELTKEQKRHLEHLAAYERALNDADLGDWARDVVERLARTERLALRLGELLVGRGVKLPKEALEDYESIKGARK